MSTQHNTEPVGPGRPDTDIISPDTYTKATNWMDGLVRHSLLYDEGTPFRAGLNAALHQMHDTVPVPVQAELEDRAMARAAGLIQDGDTIADIEAIKNGARFDEFLLELQGRSEQGRWTAQPVVGGEIASPQPEEHLAITVARHQS